MTTAVVPLRFQVGARSLAVVRRRLARVAWSLDDVRASRALALPPLDGDGYLLTSVPATLASEVLPPGLLAMERQRYTRFYADLSGDYDGWLAALAGDRRAALRRKARKVAALDGGSLDVRPYRTASELAIFHPLARAVSRRTFQERLLSAGLPTDPRATGTLHKLAAADRLRAWLLFVAGRPVAYLCCTAVGSTLRYDYLGHDPAFAALSPGTVLQHAAMRDLFDDRFACLDFTEGEGQHKRLFATGGVACVDLLVLRPTWRNWLTAAALTRFDALVAAGKRRLRSPTLGRLAARLRR